MKFSLSNYWKPTPKKIRKIADAFLASAMCMATFSFFSDYKEFALYIMLISGVAKFISNFFADEAQ